MRPEVDSNRFEIWNFISLRTFTLHMENSLQFEISLQSKWPKWNLSEVSFTSPEAMWSLIRKLPYTGLKFQPEVKSPTGLSSLWVSCKRALTHHLEIQSKYNQISIIVDNIDWPKKSTDKGLYFLFQELTYNLMWTLWI